MIKLLWSWLFLVIGISICYQSARFITKPIRRNLVGRAHKSKETRHEHRPAFDQGVHCVKHAIKNDSPTALRRALRQFKSRPSLYIKLQIVALDSAKAEEDKDWVYDIVDAVNIADRGQINSIIE